MKKNNINVSTVSCECSFFINMTLSCKHIFAVRKHFKQELFSKDLIRDRFSKEFFIQHQVKENEVLNTDDTENIAIISNVPKCKPKILNSHEKYKKSINLFQNIASSLSDYGHVQFSEIFEKLKNLKTYIDERIPFTINASSPANLKNAPHAQVVSVIEEQLLPAANKVTPIKEAESFVEQLQEIVVSGGEEQLLPAPNQMILVAEAESLTEQLQEIDVSDEEQLIITNSR